MWGFRILLAIFLVAPAAVRAQQAIGRPDVHVGDRWTFQQRDGLTEDLQNEFTRRVVTVSPTEITAVLQVKGRPGQSVLYFTRDWNIEDNGTMKNDPAPLMLRFPMKQGDNWPGQYRSRTLATGAIANCRTSSKVATRETVQVLAGSFDSLRVDSRVECRSGDINAAVVLFASSNWYAPAVKAIIKTISSGIYEGRERNRTVTEMLSYSLSERAEPAPEQVPPDPLPLPRVPATPSAAPPALPEKGI